MVFLISGSMAQRENFRFSINQSPWRNWLARPTVKWIIGRLTVLVVPRLNFGYCSNFAQSILSGDGFFFFFFVLFLVFWPARDQPVRGARFTVVGERILSPPRFGIDPFFLSRILRMRLFQYSRIPFAGGEEVPTPKFEPTSSSFPYQVQTFLLLLAIAKAWDDRERDHTLDSNGLVVASAPPCLLSSLPPGC